MSKAEVRKRLDTFLIQCDPTASIPKWSGALDAALSHALKYQAIDIKSILVTKPEMDRIDALKGRQIQRLAFTLLCLAKYWDTITQKPTHWVNTKDSDIMKMANINTSIKRQSLMYHSLNEEGMINFSRKVDNTNVRVCFMEDGEPAIRVTDFRNLGYQYLRYHGEPYFVCQNCGITTRCNNQGVGRRPKYCPECATQVALQQMADSVTRRRERFRRAI